jgi:adenylate kinase family enzyme
VERIAIIGSSCSGKTTLGRSVAKKMGAVSIDLDELHWEPCWKMAPVDVFDERLQKALTAPKWVTSGNYSRVQEQYLVPADTLIWLDYSFTTVLWRALRRTWRRVVRRELCCNGNVETLQGTFSRESIILWGLQNFKRRRLTGEMLFAPDVFPHLDKMRFRTPQETQKWLDSL